MLEQFISEQYGILTNFSFVLAVFSVFAIATGYSLRNIPQLRFERMFGIRLDADPEQIRNFVAQELAFRREVWFAAIRVERVVARQQKMLPGGGWTLRREYAVAERRDGVAKRRMREAQALAERFGIPRGDFNLECPVASESPPSR